MTNSRLFFLYTLLIITANAFGQFNNTNNMNNMNGQQNIGLNRNIGGFNSSPVKSSPEDIEKNKMQQIDKFMAKLEKELSLDALQTIAIKNEVVSNGKNIDNIIKAEISDEQRSKELENSLDKSEIIIKSYLNKAQKVKYDLMKEEAKVRTNETKKKKKTKQEKEKATD